MLPVSMDCPFLINADDTDVIENKESNNEETKAMLDKNQNGSV
jgi:hypothetical protein